MHEFFKMEESQWRSVQQFGRAQWVGVLSTKSGTGKIAASLKMSELRLTLGVKVQALQDGVRNDYIRSRQGIRGIKQKIEGRLWRRLRGKEIDQRLLEKRQCQRKKVWNVTRLAKLGPVNIAKLQC